MKPIILKSKVSESLVGVVRLSSKAEKVVRRLSARSGLPIRTIVSEIIIQAENLIDIDLTVNEDDDQ